MTTVHEETARSRKALAIATLLRGHGATADTAALLSPEARETAALLADQRAPSEATWAVVVAMLRGMERTADDDPWAGLPVRQEGI